LATLLASPLPSSAQAAHIYHGILRQILHDFRLLNPRHPKHHSLRPPWQTKYLTDLYNNYADQSASLLHQDPISIIHFHHQELQLLHQIRKEAGVLKQAFFSRQAKARAADADFRSIIKQFTSYGKQMARGPQTLTTPDGTSLLSGSAYQAHILSYYHDIFSACDDPAIRAFQGGRRE